MTRRILMTLATGLALALAPLTTQAASAPDQRPGRTATAASTAPTQVAAVSTWPQRGADAARSGYTPGETALTTTTVSGMVPKYTLPTVARYGECGGYRGAGSTVSDGTLVYWYDGLRLRASGLRGGAIRWRAEPVDTSGDTFVGQIAVARGKVFLIASDCLPGGERSGSVRVYDAATGASLGFGPRVANPVSMAVVGSRLVVSGYEPLTGVLSMAGWDISTGTTVWENPACGSDYIRGSGRVFAVGGVVLSDACTDDTASALSYSAGLSLATGAPVWTKDRGYLYTLGDSPTAGRHVYLTDLVGNIVSMDTAGNRVWRIGKGHVLAASPANVYTDCGTTTSICALEPRFGLLRWRVDVGDNRYGVSQAADVVYPYLLEAATGRRLPTGPQLLTSGYVGVAAGRAWYATAEGITVYGLP